VKSSPNYIIGFLTNDSKIWMKIQIYLQLYNFFDHFAGCGRNFSVKKLLTALVSDKYCSSLPERISGTFI
jgi:hypothetical protein